ncbi:hypothetical protein C2E23DRAFT_811499 [Lenzites betulinus]|nr:hypothetical protein C2E23DRAFT_853685 [Lenzites betulinus]KAH9849961.1 hypothetical protein C2E23DRAFT_838079 [Lenzites betulinus]KAH9855709.1 hypothetical protein C2E23DRAFT_811499 [Lenzites betulinus]
MALKIVTMSLLCGSATGQSFPSYLRNAGARHGATRIAGKLLNVAFRRYALRGNRTVHSVTMTVTHLSLFSPMLCRVFV